MKKIKKSMQIINVKVLKQLWCQQFKHIILIIQKLQKLQNKRMDFLKTVAGLAVDAAQSYYANYTKEQKLREDLKKCTYTDDVKFVIEKAAKQVFNVYPNFTIEILQFMEKGQVKRYLQLKSEVDIQIKGKVCKVDYYMMLPVNFPKKPPYVRIVNKDPTNIVHNFYLPLRSPTDPNSFILNEKLVQCKTWDENKSIVNIIIESHNMMRQNFPFMKPEPNSFNQYGNQQYNNQYGNQYGNQGFYQNSNQGFNQYGGNNQNYGFVNQNSNQNNMNSNMNNNNKPRPPIPFVTTNVNEIIAKGQKFTGQSKKIMQKLKSQKLKSIQKIQQMQIIKSCLQSEQQYLRHQNIKIINFLRSNERSSIQQSSLIRVRDERSEQILDLTSSIRSKEDCLNLLETKFNQNQIGFQEFIKIARKLQEEKFQEKFLLGKCVDKAK